MVYFQHPLKLSRHSNPIGKQKYGKPGDRGSYDDANVKEKRRSNLKERGARGLRGRGWKRSGWRGSKRGSGTREDIIQATSKQTDQVSLELLSLFNTHHS